MKTRKRCVEWVSMTSKTQHMDGGGGLKHTCVNQRSVSVHVTDLDDRVIKTIVRKEKQPSCVRCAIAVGRMKEMPANQSKAVFPSAIRRENSLVVAPVSLGLESLSKTTRNAFYALWRSLFAFCLQRLEQYRRGRPA
jgi:hypothetical protein